MERPNPRIEVIDAAQVSLSSRVVIPRRLRAHFDGDPPAAVEIEMVHHRPVVRSVTIGSDADDLVSNDLRVPLTGELVPAAVRAACSTLLAGPPGDDTQRLVPHRIQPGEVGVIGPIRVVARTRQDLASYARSAKNSMPRRRGRPPLSVTHDELEEIAGTYREVRSFAKTGALHNMSTSKARRRIQQARAAGIDC